MRFIPELCVRVLKLSGAVASSISLSRARHRKTRNSAATTFRQRDKLASLAAVQQEPVDGAISRARVSPFKTTTRTPRNHIWKSQLSMPPSPDQLDATDRKSRLRNELWVLGSALSCILKYAQGVGRGHATMVEKGRKHDKTH
jgi:hypothetical protein